MSSVTLSLNVPLRFGADPNGSYIVTSDRLPMLLIGDDAESAMDEARCALHVAANYVLTHGVAATRAYFTRRGVDFTLIEDGGERSARGLPAKG